MIGVIMAPCHCKPDAPTHPLVPQRIARGAPATRRDNLWRKSAFRLCGRSPATRAAACRSPDPNGARPILSLSHPYCRIKYGDDVLAWVEGQGTDVIVMNRAQSRVSTITTCSSS